MSQTLKVVAQLHIQPEQVSVALPLFQTLVKQVREEHGCIAYVLFQNTHDSAKFTMIEEWADESALAQHAEALKASAIFQQIMPLLAGAPDVQTYFEV